MTTDPRAGAEDAIGKARRAYMLSDEAGRAFGTNNTLTVAQRAFNAGFAAGLAHATTPAEPSTTAAEPGRVARMEAALEKLKAIVPHSFTRTAEMAPDRDDLRTSIVHCDPCPMCIIEAALLGGSDGTGA